VSSIEDSKENVTIIYQTRNDSPKHIEINRKKIILFFVGLPFLTLIGLSLGIIGLINTSPLHLIQNYQKNSEAREAIKEAKLLRDNLKSSQEANTQLTIELDKIKATNVEKISEATAQLSSSNNANNKLNCPPTLGKESNLAANSIGLSFLSLFKPIQSQKNRTNPPSLSLNDFKVVNNRDFINLQFNIINLLGGDIKLSGHIVVLLKNDQILEVYPMNALGTPGDFQINYTAGEPFATQRFRPVDASFIKPKKGGNYVFAVFIFAKNGDLIHYQTTNINVKV
jgi:hypothetical protein